MPTFEFDQAATRRAMRLSVWEGMSFAVMMAFGEAYFVADAVRLGATPAQVGLLVALPLSIGSIGAVSVPRVLQAVGRRKPVVLAAVALQVGVLATIAGAEVARTLTPQLLLALASAYQVLGQAAGVAWGSWYGDVVPADVRGRYFARRSRFANVAMFLSLIAAGTVLQVLEPDAAGQVVPGAGGLGYSVVFAIAVAARLTCLVLLARSPEPTFGGIATAGEALRSFAGTDGRLMRRVVTAAFLVTFSVYIGSPYFNPFMLDVLELTYVEYTLGTLAVVATKFTVLPLWGRAIDRHGPRRTILIAAVIIAFIPLPWIFAKGFVVVVFAQSLSGLGWGGYEVSNYTLMLESADARRRPSLLAVVNALNGFAHVGGTLIGGAVLAAASGDFRAVFATTFVVRLTVALTLFRLIPDHGLSLRAARLPLRIFAWSPVSGPSYRPMPNDAEPDSDRGLG